MTIEDVGPEQEIVNTPSVVAGELIRSSWGNTVRADLTSLDTLKFPYVGGTITGNVTVNGDLKVKGANCVRVTRSNNRPFVELHDASETVRYGGLVGSATGLEVIADLGPLHLITGGVESVRVDTAATFFGKLAASASTAGLELYTGTSFRGRVWSAIDVANINYIGSHLGAADVAGVSFVRFDRTNASNVVGSITQVATTGVAYNTTSDKRLKTLAGPLDPAAAVDKVAAMEPVVFTWNDDPAAGEQVGFFAQDLYTVAPEAVTPGQGEPGDRTDDGTSSFVPWMTDLSKLAPTLVAAIQGLTARIDALEATP